MIARTTAPLRVLETSHPPTYYLPASPDFLAGRAPAGRRAARCASGRGMAASSTWSAGRPWRHGPAWYYPSPTPAFAAIVDHVALYPG